MALHYQDTMQVSTDIQHIQNFIYICKHTNQQTFHHHSYIKEESLAKIAQLKQCSGLLP